MKDDCDKSFHIGKDSLPCDYCKDDFHEACEDLMLMKNGVYKCNCVCNTKVEISN